MPKAKVVLLADARLQLRSIAAVYKAQAGAKYAKRITDRILTALRRLEDFPQMGIIPRSELLQKAGYRVLIADEYLCFYRIEGSVVYVTQILHGSVDYVKWILE